MAPKAGTIADYAIRYRDGAYLRKAIAWIIDKSGKREPSSSEIMRTCLTFVERSRADAIDSTVPYETSKAGSGFEPSIDHDWVPPDLRFGRR